MSLQKVVLFGSAALFAVGLVLRALSVELGLDLMLIAVFGAVVAVSLGQRSIQHLLATTRRTLTQRVKELGDIQGAQVDTVKELTTLQRTTLWYAKQRTTAGSIDLSASAPANGARAARAGRASTPHVTNAAADMSFAMLLDPERRVAIAGILADQSRAALPPGTTVVPFLPGRAAEAVETSTSLDLLVVDEAALAIAPWSQSTGPAGIGVMQDLIAAVRRARDLGVPTVVLPHASVPDIGSDALAKAPVLRLPLADASREQAAGAPPSAVLRALDELAQRRSE